MNDVDELICKAEADTQVENKCMDNQGGKRRGMEWEIGIDIFTLCVLCVSVCVRVHARVCVHSAVSNPATPGLQPTRLLCLWNFPDNFTTVQIIF